MSSPYERQLHKLLQSERAYSARLARRIADAQAKLGDVTANLDLEHGSSMRARLDERARKLAKWRDDPVVLVRTRGPNRYAFHDGEKTCGHVRDLSRYEERLWGQAKDQGYSPCHICGYLAEVKGKNLRREQEQEDEEGQVA